MLNGNFLRRFPGFGYGKSTTDSAGQAESPGGTGPMRCVRKRTDRVEPVRYGLSSLQLRRPMYKYRVVERWVEQSRLVLRCSKGRYYVARALSLATPPGAVLEGAKPHLGFDLLLCPQSGAIFRVIFESIGNTALPSPPNAMPGTTHRPQGESRMVAGGAA